MTEQIHEDQHMNIQDIQPLETSNIFVENWKSPAKTLAAGSLVSLLCVFMIPIYGVTYVRVLMPICLLTAITQFCINIIREMEKKRELTLQLTH